MSAIIYNFRGAVMPATAVPGSLHINTQLPPANNQDLTATEKAREMAFKLGALCGRTAFNAFRGGYALFGTALLGVCGALAPHVDRNFRE